MANKMIAIQTEQSCTHIQSYTESIQTLVHGPALYVCNSHIGDSILALTQYCLLNSSEYRLNHDSLSSTVSPMGCSTVSHICTLWFGYLRVPNHWELAHVVIQYGYQLMSCNGGQLSWRIQKAPHAAFFRLDHKQYIAYMQNTGNKGKSFGSPSIFCQWGTACGLHLLSYRTR